MQRCVCGHMHGQHAKLPSSSLADHPLVLDVMCQHITDNALCQSIRAQHWRTFHRLWTCMMYAWHSALAVMFVVSRSPFETMESWMCMLCVYPGMMTACTSHPDQDAAFGVGQPPGSGSRCMLPW